MVSTRWRPKSEGDVHPRCGTVVVRMPNMFFFRGWSGDGLVCQTCNALWSVPGEKDIFDVAKERVEQEQALWRGETVDLLDPSEDSQ